MTTTAAAVGYSVGQRITGSTFNVRRVMDALPIGSQIQGQNMWTKQPDGTWVGGVAGNTITSAGFRNPTIHIRRIGMTEAATSEWAINQRLTLNQIAALPVGSRITGNYRWEKTGPDLWIGGHSGDRRLTNNEFSERMSLTSLPAPTPVESAQHLSRLEVGTRVLNTQSGRVWTKLSSGNWESDGGSVRSAARLSEQAGLVVQSTTPSVPEVGNLLTTTQVAALPIGSRIMYNNYDARYYDKIAVNHWRAYSRGTLRDADFPSHSYRLVSVGDGTWTEPPFEGPPNYLQVGDGVCSLWEVMALPPGTTIMHHGDSQTRYVKNGMDSWRQSTSEAGHHSYNDATFANPGYAVHSYPDGYTPEPRTGPKRETLTAFKRRFWLAATGQGRASGINMRPVEFALRLLETNGEGMRPAPGMLLPGVYAPYDNQILDGTVAYVGDPKAQKYHGVFTYRNGQWTHVLGGWTNPAGATLTIEAVPSTNGTEWFDGEGGPEEDAKVAQFKSRAWRLGYRAKMANGWCGAFETAMAAVGITAASVANCRDYLTGDWREPAGVLGLPEGSILYWRHRDDASRWAFYIRSGENNEAGTRLLFGPETRSHYKTQMEVIYDAGNAAALSIPLYDETLVPHLPVGTRITHDLNGNRWTWGTTGWSEANGYRNYRSRDLGIAAFSITEIPVQAPTAAPAAPLLEAF